MLAVGIFGNDDNAAFAGYNGSANGHHPFRTGEQFGVQLVGILAIIIWALSSGAILFIAVREFVGLRVSGEVELVDMHTQQEGANRFVVFEISPAEARREREAARAEAELRSKASSTAVGGSELESAPTPSIAWWCRSYFRRHIETGDEARNDKGCTRNDPSSFNYSQKNGQEREGRGIAGFGGVGDPGGGSSGGSGGAGRSETSGEDLFIQMAHSHLSAEGLSLAKGTLKQLQIVEQDQPKEQQGFPVDAGQKQRQQRQQRQRRTHAELERQCDEDYVSDYYNDSGSDDDDDDDDDLCLREDGGNMGNGGAGEGGGRGRRGLVVMNRISMDGRRVSDRGITTRFWNSSNISYGAT